MQLTKILEYYVGKEIDYDNDEVVLIDRSDGNGVSILQWNLDIPKPSMEDIETFITNNQEAFNTIEKIEYDINRCDRLIYDALKIRTDDTLRFSLVAKKKTLIATKNELIDNLIF